MADVITPIASAVGGIVNGLFSFFGNRETNKTNATLTRETNAQNEALMREQWAREDNAVQRRAEDLEKAGLSKTLAAGSPASAGALATMQKPEYENPTQAALDTAYKTMSMVQDFQRRQNENNLLAAQIKNIDTKTAGDVIDNSIKNFTLTETLPLDRDIKDTIYQNNLATLGSALYNLEVFGNTKGPSGVLKQFWDLANVGGSAIGSFNNAIQDFALKQGWIKKKSYLYNPGMLVYNNSINQRR